MGLFNDMHQQKIEEMAAQTRLVEAQAHEHQARADAERASVEAAESQLAAAAERHQYEFAVLKLFALAVTVAFIVHKFASVVVALAL